MRLASAALFLAALSAVPAAAAPWAIDRSHATVAFSVDHLGFSLVQGVFRSFDAEIDFDPKNIETAKVSFTIDAASVDTFWEARDTHIKSADFLDAAAHPAITFVSKSVRRTGDDAAEVTGDVTIKGVTREETFSVTLRKIGPSPFNPSLIVAGFTVAGEIDRTDYGVAFGAPAIGTAMPVRIDLEISPK